MSSKPITYKHYDLSRFSASLRLPEVQVEGYSTEPPKIVEVDLCPQHPRRRLSLKVSPDDEIDEIADQLLGEGFFHRSGQIVRVAISVRYRGPADTRAKRLSLCVSHPNNSNLRSMEEPSQRELASALLKEWGVLQAFQPLSPPQQRSLLPTLVELYALPGESALGSDLRSRGFDIEDLARSGFIVRRGRHKLVLIEPDAEGPEEVSLELGHTSEQMIFRGTDGLTATMPTSLVEQFTLRRSYIEETIADNLRPCFERWSFARCDDNLAFLGELHLSFGPIPCYLARGLEDRRVFERLDVRLRSENSGRRGVVLDTGDTRLSFLAAHVVLPLRDYLTTGDEQALDRDAISAAFDRLRNLATSTGAVDLICHGNKSATLIIPDKKPLSLMGGKQIIIFERLVEAYRRVAPSVSTRKLMEGMKAGSPQNAFTPERWSQINGVYIEKVGSRSGWRLVIEPGDRTDI